jgi:hypothetical protein
MALIVWNFVFQNLCIAAAYRPVEELLEEEKVIEFNIFFSMIYALLQFILVLGTQYVCFC